MMKRSTAVIHSFRPWLSVRRKIQFAGNSAGIDKTWRKPVSRTTEAPSGQNSTANFSALPHPSLRRDAIHGDYTGQEPRASGDLAGLHRRYARDRPQQFAPQRRV